MSQRTFAVTIEGISPLIQNNPESSNKKRQLKPNPTRRSSPEDPQEEWRCRAYYLNEDGTLGHPAEAMEMCLREAALIERVGIHETSSAILDTARFPYMV